jgi:fumarate reductase flavoprotein subunit
MSQELSRRSFLTGTLATAATAAAAGLLVGCSPSSSSSSTTTSSTTTSTVGTTFTSGGHEVGVLATASSTETADIVVVGSGIGGFFASMIAKEQGPSLNVVMLEKNTALGGSTNYAECNGPASNQADQAARKAGFTSAEGTNFIANSMLHYERMKEAGDNADWLFGKHGCGWYKSGVTFYAGGNGASAISTLTPIATSEGVDIRKNARAFALVVNDEYTVTGVQYEDENGSVVQINCKAVILATGGMSTNKDLLGQYSSQDMDKIIGWGDGQDGDGHLMVEQTAHGRANHLTVDSLFNNVGDGTTDHFAYNSVLGVSVAMQYTECFVNEYGIRFADESDGGALGTSTGGKLIESQGYVFSIVDKAGLDKYAAGACTRHYSGFADKCVGATIDLDTELTTYANKDYVFKANTIKELGQAIQKVCTTFDVNAFVSEIANYNTYATSGTDSDYGKGATYLWNISEAPYYAFQICSGMLNTSGGIRINRNAQVVDARGVPVEGLYAAGVCTSGWDGEVYGGGTCQTVGMWAGSKAARYILENTFGLTVASDWMGDVLSTSTSPVSS